MGDTPRTGSLLAVALGAVLALAGLVAPTPPVAGQTARARATDATEAPRPTEPLLPIVFVHGGSGSAAQYETQALRFASNGYPYEVWAVDRPSGQDTNQVLDDFIDGVLAETGAPRVYLVAHSIGNPLVTAYLNSSPERAARVAKYAGIESAGASPDACPGGVDDAGDWIVPCKGIFGRGDPNRRHGPDDNVQFPDQGHTEVVGSPESFVEQYRFFTGRHPHTTLVLPQPPGHVDIAGRALNFPANTPLVGVTVEVWEVDGDTGARTRRRPRATFTIDETGDWGPVRVDGRKHYELAVTRDGFVQHVYYEPFLRSDHLVRLLLSPPDSPISQGIERSDRHSSAVVQRQKEFWGDNPLGPVDVLNVSTHGGHEEQPPVDVINPATASYQEMFVLGIITFDAGSDGVTDTAQKLPLETFLSAVDVYYPAANPPDGTITFDHRQRGEPRPQVINTPNWPSTGHGISVNLRDWTQEIDTWRECRRARPSPCR